LAQGFVRHLTKVGIVLKEYLELFAPPALLALVLVAPRRGGRPSGPLARTLAVIVLVLGGAVAGASLLIGEQALIGLIYLLAGAGAVSP
jgi:hypothetical protein